MRARGHSWTIQARAAYECLNYPYRGDGRSLGDHLPVVTLQKFTAEQELKRLGYSSTGKAINRVPFVVFAKWVTSHWHSAIVVKGITALSMWPRT
jgi:hypothetical protein